ncbi:hypothetical protein Micbo1qcDRAFT_215839 [Microdochium bolleyi]|uniref:Zn(2)-C6 fungal-type domain-containing protein n=1 Tax=Microdochium bolleyi TaxID=196109 RepID=A0A136IRV2_9PEZI|nr:hypothetical protein Micbo1qcDRAFT_215839 [Microdochium bolleyi]
MAVFILEMQGLPPCGHQAQGGTAKKSSRVGAPKVKSGCRSCKIAHLKCDEQKPGCGRCQRRGTACIYPTALTRAERIAEAKQLPLRALQPATKSTLTSGGGGGVRILKETGTGALRLHHPIQLRPSSLSPMSSRDIVYFDQFQHYVASRSSAFGLSEFLRRTVLRESTRDECTRHAVLAFGAITRALENQRQEASRENFSAPRLPLYKAGLGARTGTSGKMWSHTHGQDHYYRAPLHYTKAISLLRRRIKNAAGGAHHRAILIATTLLCSFEHLQGNIEAADSLAAHCVALLREKLMGGSLTGRNSGRVGTDDQGEREQPSLIAASLDDDGIVEAETELVRNTCINAAFSPLYPRARLVLLGLPVPKFTGPSPPPLEESLQVWSAAWDRCMTMVCMWYYHVRTSLNLSSRKPRDATPAHSRGLPTGATAAVKLDPGHVRREHRCEQRRILAVLDRWKAAVEQRTQMLLLRRRADPGCRHATSCEDPREREETAHYHRISIIVEGCYYSVCAVFDIAGWAWDNHQAATSALLDRCEDAVNAGRPAAERSPAGRDACCSEYDLRDQAVNYGGTATVIAQIAQESRLPRLRHRAMELWGRMVSARSPWEVQGAYLGAKALVDAEEELRGAAEGEADSGCGGGGGSLSPKKQLFSSRGVWSDDYSEFKVTLMAIMPDKNGYNARRIVVMPAIGR